MSDLLSLKTEMLTSRTAKLTLLKFLLYLQLSLFVGFRQNMSGTFISHDCHRRESAGRIPM